MPSTDPKQNFQVSYTKIKSDLTTLLVAFLHEQQQQLSRNKLIKDISADLFTRLEQFNTGGKMLRGSLVPIFYEAFSTNSHQNPSTAKDKNLDALLAGAAIELLESAVLIHDDVIDRDKKRRNNPSIFAQYEKNSAPKNTVNSRHFGYSMAICAGDINIFLAEKILQKISDNKKSELQQLFSAEMTSLCFAEMQDVKFANDEQEQTLEQIFDLYAKKTGRYTFSLPLLTAAILADIQESKLQLLSELGEIMGVIYQLKDDELNIIGNETKIGKSTGSDILEGKKTAHYLFLMQHTSPSEKKQISTIFGNKTASRSEIQSVVEIMNKYQVIQQVANQINSQATSARQVITKLNLNATTNETLETILKIIEHREK